MSTHEIARVTPGVPAGGQFAATARSEASVTLTEVPAARVTLPDDVHPRVREVAAAVEKFLPADWSGHAYQEPGDTSAYGSWNLDLTQDDESAWATVNIWTDADGRYVEAYLFNEDGTTNRSLSSPDIGKALAPLIKHIGQWSRAGREMPARTSTS